MFHVWIVVPVSFEENKLFSYLNQRGYKTTAAAEDGSLFLTTDGCKSGMIAFRLEREAIHIKEAYDLVAETLQQENLEYYGLVISEFSANSVWDAGNVMSDKYLSFSTVKATKNNIN